MNITIRQLLSLMDLFRNIILVEMNTMEETNSLEVHKYFDERGFRKFDNYIVNSFTIDTDTSNNSVLKVYYLA